MRSLFDVSIGQIRSRAQISRRLRSLGRLINHVTARRLALTTTVLKLAAANDKLTATNNKLTAANNDLTYRHLRLSQRVDGLVAQLNVAGLRALDGSPEMASPSARRHLIKSARRTKFLVMSNLRSGSTWLETMLGALPDVFTDFEFKFAISYRPSAVHRVLSEDLPSVTDVLEGMVSRAPVVGSKFVFDFESTRS